VGWGSGFSPSAAAAPDRAEALAAAAGISLYEAQRHLAAGGPRVLATYGRSRGRCDRGQRARGRGLRARDLRMTTRRFSTGVLVRSFVLGARTLGVTDRQGTRLEVPFTAIAVMLRGIRTLGPDDREPFLDVHAAGPARCSRSASGRCTTTGCIWSASPPPPPTSGG
jgi:hypothetical protein